MSGFDDVAMCEFLLQFKLLNDFSVEDRLLKNQKTLNEAKAFGFVEAWVPPKGATYCGATTCTLKGRLFLKKNT